MIASRAGGRKSAAKLAHREVIKNAKHLASRQWAIGEKRKAEDRETERKRGTGEEKKNRSENGGRRNFFARYFRNNCRLGSAVSKFASLETEWRPAKR